MTCHYASKAHGGLPKQEVRTIIMAFENVELLAVGFVKRVATSVQRVNHMMNYHNPTSEVSSPLETAQ
eukprot:5555981-Pyramimonas_sp.AAC.1